MYVYIYEEMFTYIHTYTRRDSSVDEHLGSFQILAIMNWISISMGVQTRLSHIGFILFTSIHKAFKFGGN